MLDHENASEQRPARVVVVGSASFVGGAILERLGRDGVRVLALARADIDLRESNASERLAGLLTSTDAVVAVAAVAPCTTADKLVENMIIARNIAAALASAPVAHVINISSDAVYADSDEPLTESSAAAPSSIHGAMHIAREIVFRSAVAGPLTMLRPTLIYGARDPHNGYGPNRFVRLAKAGKPIVLFGDGEERRDHVFIDDVAELTVRALYRRSAGELNIVAGAVHSFREIAEQVSGMAPTPIDIQCVPRSGPMPHNGYRPFDASGIERAFPEVRMTPLDVGLRRLWGGTSRSAHRG